MSQLIGAFLEMLSAERGAAKNTIDAYRRDLSGYAGFVSGRRQTLLTATRDTVTAYLDQLRRDGLSASSSARCLSAIRQFHRFLCADTLRSDDPTRIIASPKSARALPKVLSIAEVDRLLTTAEAAANAPDEPEAQAAALRLYATGYSTTEVATHMNVQYETAKTYLRRVREKYARVGRPASKKADLIRRAAEDGYLE